MKPEEEALLGKDDKNGHPPPDGAADGNHHLQTSPTPSTLTGLTVSTASVFLVGEMAGGGVLALPNAIDHAGWVGLALIFLGCLASAINGITLGKCWIMLLERYPDEFKDQHIRKPYPKIGEKAVGKWMSYVVSVTMDFTLFGAACVFLIISSQNTGSLIEQAGAHLPFCYLLIILAAVLTPALWFGTPKDFWPIAVGAAVCTGIACLLILINLFMDLPDSSEPHREVARSRPTFKSLFLAYGAIVFAFGGASAFPTVQQDMKSPEHFGKVVIAAYIALLSLYVPVATVGYIVYGDDLQNNILQNLPPGGITIAVQILMTLHFLFAIVIALNPFAQELEDICNIPPGFTWKRCVVRTVLIGCLLLVAESIPHFGALLDLIGGSTVSFMTFVAPSLFFLRLSSQEGDWPNRPVSLHMKVICIEMMAVGILGGIASTISAISEITGATTFIPPCFVNSSTSPA